MDEQEGIDIETLNPDNSGTVLPDVEEPETENKTSPVEETDTQTEQKDEKDQHIYEQERKARKAAEKKNRELEARIKALEDANKEPEKTTLELLTESGIDENVAKSIAGAIDKKSAGAKKAEKDLEDMRFNYQLSEQSKKVGFEDITDYADEIKDLMNKGLTIEQSYYALTGGKETSNTKSEITRKVEAKLENKEARKEILGKINTPGTSVANNSKTVKATPEEIAIAKAAGISIEEYKALQGIDNMKDYNSYEKGKSGK